jgi:hypothetical protein
VRKIEASKLIFIDESGVNLAQLRLYARALIVQKDRGRKPQKRGRNISIVSAISLEKVVRISQYIRCSGCGNI